MKRGWAALAALFAALACSSTPERPDERYDPSRSVLEVVAVLRKHVPDDTYRFDPARDFTGRNVYRASLLRLENLEHVHAEALREGLLDDVISFAKGRSFERLRAYSLAAESYRLAAEREGPLRIEALRSAALCDALAEARTIAPEPALPDAAPDAPGPLRRDEAAAVYEQRIALLRAMLPDVADTHYEAVVREEVEAAQMERAGFLRASRRLYADGDVRALAATQQLVRDNRESKNANEHILDLGDLYAELAEEYVEQHPPESLTFDPPRFEELVEGAARLYEAISNQDGAPEKIEASRRLEAFLAFTLQVDRDRFSP